MKIYCPYCGKEAKWCENKEIYGENLGKSYMCYLCKDCDAYVGCHKNTREPLGTLANKELREWRIRTHRAIDRYWTSNICTRKRIYSILKNIFKKEVHVGESDIEMCKKIIKETDDRIPKILKVNRW